MVGSVTCAPLLPLRADADCESNYVDGFAITVNKNDSGRGLLKHHAQNQPKSLSLLRQCKRPPFTSQNTVGKNRFPVIAPAYEVPRLLAPSLQAIIHSSQERAR